MCNWTPLFSSNDLAEVERLWTALDFISVPLESGLDTVTIFIGMCWYDKTVYIRMITPYTFGSIGWYGTRACKDPGLKFCYNSIMKLYTS